MSYSFSFTVPTKDEAKAKVVSEFVSVVAQQPNHSKDADQAAENAYEAIDLLADDETQDIRVECYGSLMWSTDPEQITGVTIHAYAAFVAKATV